ncbi:hypothetical protein [Streptomyces sp. NBC_01262]|uniref:hypothetical protein n=1 Tax=Streptomyces sp. NBC_01262 TaxID=2903803 RepID=UPI002E2EA98E|nr:hypothetical protein [Streptomyces sp. NBC_01262]
MSDSPLPARLSPAAAGYLRGLDPTVQELVRDVLELASRAPLHFPQWDLADPEGVDLRAASIGPLTVIYWINRTEPPHLYVLDIVWVQ